MAMRECNAHPGAMDLLDRLVSLSTLVAALGAGLVAGTFFAFSTFIMPALSRLAPAEGVAAMQSINVTVFSRVFMSVFLGTAALALALAVSALAAWHRPGSALQIGGALAYLVGSLGVTVAANVPRNEAIARLAPPSTEAIAMWPRYVAEWTTYNHARALAALASAALLIAALVARARA